MKMTDKEIERLANEYANYSNTLSQITADVAKKHFIAGVKKALSLFVVSGAVCCDHYWHDNTTAKQRQCLKCGRIENTTN